MITPQTMHYQKQCLFSPLAVHNWITDTMRDTWDNTCREYKKSVTDDMLHFIPFIPAYSRVVAYESIDYVLTDEFVAMMLVHFINWDYKEEDIPTLVRAIQISVLPELQVHLEKARSHDNSHTFWFRDDIMQLMSNLICTEIRNDDKLTRVLKTYRNVLSEFREKGSHPLHSASGEFGEILMQERCENHLSVYKRLFITEQKDECEDCVECKETHRHYCCAYSSDYLQWKHHEEDKEDEEEEEDKEDD